MVAILPHLPKELVFLDFPETEKGDILRRISTAQANYIGVDPEIVEKAILEREQVMSTGIGEGIAIPHAKIAQADQILLAFARPKSPIEFSSLDGQPVQLIFQLVGPTTGVGDHVKVMARLARILKDASLRNLLEKSESPDGVMDVLRQRGA